MPSSSLARVVQRPNFSWATPYGNVGVNYLGGNRGAGLRNRIADETGDRTREFMDRGGPRIADETGDRTAEFIPNPNLPGTALANNVQKNLDVAQNTQAGNLAAAARMVPNMTPTNVAAPRTPGATTTPMGDLGVANGTVVRGEPAPGNPGVPTFAADAPINPVTGQPTAMGQAQNERDLWMARGGSEAGLHRAQVAQGRRPAIDGRTVHSPMEGPSDASMAAVRGFGDSAAPSQIGHSAWPTTTTGNAGSALWAQMSQKFDSARANLRANLAGQPAASTANVIPLPPQGDTYQWPRGQFPGIPDAANATDPDAGLAQQDQTYTPPDTMNQDYY